MFTLVPMVLGQIWTAMDETNMPIPNQDWQDTYNDTQGTLQYIIPLVPSIGIVLIVIKVLMVSTIRGRD
jgi:hypothetical protein